MLRDYFELCKPKVVALILFTAAVGMALSEPGLPDLNWLFGLAGIGLAAAAAAAANHWVDMAIDARMARTAGRPLPQGKITPMRALAFAAGLAVLAMLILWFLVNPLTAGLTFVTLLGYAVLYSVFLKHATPQNIVLGGAAGAAPPVLGWTAVAGTVGYESLLLFLIIFIWTPPHFWALAIKRVDEYARAGVPMLPVAYGIAFTKLHILLYAILLVAVSLLPFVVGMSGGIYLIGAILLGGGFFYYALRLYRGRDDAYAMPTFGYSIFYLGMIFALLLVDKYVRVGLGG